MEFNFCDFLKTINDSDPDGILLSYDGFNPSDIESEDFARITINGNQVLNVIEKSALTASQCTSAGGYYFKSWSLFKETLKYQLKYPAQFGQYLYVSLLYNILINQGKKVKNYFTSNNLQVDENCNILGSLEFGGLSNYWGLQVDKDISEYIKHLKKSTIKSIKRHFYNLLKSSGFIGEFILNKNPHKLIKIINS